MQLCESERQCSYERLFLSCERMNITALQDFWCSPARPSNRTIMKVYTLEKWGLYNYKIVCISKYLPHRERRPSPSQRSTGK